ncbi:MAG: hypothetical protein UT34_C0001G0415 [candidate division WS6 bacterium GW2011_GWF2_39_15]|uniref:Deoxynucleoside kinase domain-containing protein n=1 Tax=candidate division WS6 bacterium GW2011_GWF2_39_15 TaxID=1619100 RepID=A0A0G0Q7F6_9BACT|nr:MAG: hypothetical protein UT34_C0001G0415 [candidate division WS6 bacterium GW2011_GWF2_39_15]
MGDLVYDVTRGDASDVSFYEHEFIPRMCPDFVIPPNILSIELIGIGDGGKSTVAEAVCSNLRQLGIECQWHREFEVGEIELDRRIREIVLSSARDLKVEDDYIFKDQLLKMVEELKLLSLLAVEESLKESIRKDGYVKGTNVVHLFERGPNDYIALSGWALSYLEGISRKLDRKLEMDIWYDKMLFAFEKTKYFKSVALFYIDNLDVILQRRTRQGLKHKAVMGNEDDFGSVNLGYKRWLKYFHPATNCGLLTINGENSIENNTERLTKHITDHFYRHNLFH